MQNDFASLVEEVFSSASPPWRRGPRHEVFPNPEAREFEREALRLWLGVDEHGRGTGPLEGSSIAAVADRLCPGDPQAVREVVRQFLLWLQSRVDTVEE